MMRLAVALLAALGSGSAAPAGDGLPPVVAPGAEVQTLASGFEFTEGPATDSGGNVVFTDIPPSRVHRWSQDGELSLLLSDTNRANGLYWDDDGNLLMCQERQLVSRSPDGEVTVLADRYQGKRLNRVNDLWIDPRGGIYFTDPHYGRTPEILEQDGEHVYYLDPDRKTLTRVIDDMVRPNGIIGTPDGKTLYVADHGGKKTWAYDVQEDGSLANKTLFAPEPSDGMTLDEEGNVYLTDDAVLVYDASGRKLGEIPTPERPTNVTFGGTDSRTLFITARKHFCSVKMRVRGAARATADR